MRRIVHALILFLFATPLAAQTEIVIYAVSPSVVRAGNELVTVQGENFEINCILPCPTRLFLGSQEVPLITATRNQIAFRAPSHPGGVAIFTIRRGDNATATFSVTYQTTGTSFEKALLPIWIEQTPGARGSEWVTSLTLHNSAITSVIVAHVTCPAVCPPVFPFGVTVQPKETLRNPDIARNKPGEPPGRLIYMSANGAPAMKASLNLRDHVRDPLYGGADLPVVREREFFSSFAHILDVPIDPRFRQALRVYDVDSQTRSEFAIRIYSLTSATPIAETRMVTTGRPVELTDTPGYAQILDLSAAFPQVRAAGRLRIEIESLTQTRFWAFVSITEDATQRVRTILPQ